MNTGERFNEPRRVLKYGKWVRNRKMSDVKTEHNYKTHSRTQTAASWPLLIKPSEPRRNTKNETTLFLFSLESILPWEQITRLLRAVFTRTARQADV